MENETLINKLTSDVYNVMSNAMTLLKDYPPLLKEEVEAEVESYKDVVNIILKYDPKTLEELVHHYNCNLIGMIEHTPFNGQMTDVVSWEEKKELCLVHSLVHKFLEIYKETSISDSYRWDGIHCNFIT